MLVHRQKHNKKASVFSHYMLYLTRIQASNQDRPSILNKVTNTQPDTHRHSVSLKRYEQQTGLSCELFAWVSVSKATYQNKSIFILSSARQLATSPSHQSKSQALAPGRCVSFLSLLLSFSSCPSFLLLPLLFGSALSFFLSSSVCVLKLGPFIFLRQRE